jgi:membrane protease YdiL (CAAX protease family)
LALAAYPRKRVCADKHVWRFLESGYFIQSLQRYGVWSAVLASACFRAFLHACHGITALIIIFPFELVFGFIYWRWRRLWPLFVAHVLFDLAADFPG